MCSTASAGRACEGTFLHAEDCLRLEMSSCQLVRRSYLGSLAIPAARSKEASCARRIGNNDLCKAAYTAAARSSFVSSFATLSVSKRGFSVSSVGSWKTTLLPLRQLQFRRRSAMASANKDEVSNRSKSFASIRQHCLDWFS